MKISHRLVLYSFVGLALGAPACARGDEQAQPVADSSIVISGSRIAYFSDVDIIQARGDVRVSLPDGAAVSGDAFSMDLRLHRFVVAGHVRLSTPAGSFVGAGFADFLAFRRAYFLPLDPTADRWTFLNGDYAQPDRGRSMPGDAFFLPDTSMLRPYAVASSAVIDPAGYVKFRPATIAVLGGPDTPPFPVYVYNFSENPNFGVNSLSGSTLDAPLNFAGSAVSLDTLHFRYDQNAADKTYLSFEHHSTFRNGYAVVSVNPATQALKQWNLVSYFPAGAKAAMTLDAQLFTYQQGLTQPLSANGFADLQVTAALRQSSLLFELTPQYGNLLAPNALGYYGDPTHAYSARHPFTTGLSWSGFTHPLVARSLFFRLASGAGDEHDALGLGGAAVSDVRTRFLDGLAYTPVFPGPFRTGVTAAYEFRRTWLSFPNSVDTRTLTLTDSKRLSDHLFAIASLVDARASTGNVNLTFASPNMSTGLAPEPQSNDGIPPVGGVGIYPNQTFADNRAYALAASYQPSPTFQLTASLQQNLYDPGQSPGGFGPPRYQFALNVRSRLTRSMFLDVGRSYFFNWAGLGWTPRFSLQLSPQ